LFSRESGIEAENAGAQIAIGEPNRVAKTEGDVLIRSHIPNTKEPRTPEIVRDASL
jgi:hypothetical protein